MTDPIPDNPEYFPTPPWPPHRLLEKLPLPGGQWLEPCVGEGHLVRAVNAVRQDVKWTTQDIRPTDAAQHVGDYLKRQPPGWFDVGKTNPPFSKALAIVRRMLEQCRHVVILQRLDWCATEERHEFMQSTTPDLYVIPEKVSYVNGKTDLRHYAWYHWHEGTGDGDLFWLDRTPALERNCTPETLQRQMGMF